MSDFNTVVINDPAPTAMLDQLMNGNAQVELHILHLGFDLSSVLPRCGVTWNILSIGGEQK